MLPAFAAIARPYLPRYATGFVLLLVTNGLSLWIPWLLGDAIRGMQQGVAPRVIAGLAASIIAVALGQAVVRTVSRRTVLGASRHIAYDVRKRYFAQLQRLEPAYYDTHRTGDIMSRGVNDVRLVQGFYGPGVLNLLNTSIVYVAVLVLLLRIDVVLTAVSLLLYPPLFFGVNRLSRRVYSRSRAVQEQLGEIANRAQENLSGIQQVKIYAQEEREVARFREAAEKYRRLSLSMAALRGGMIALIGVITGLGTLVVLFVGGKLVIDGRIGLGDFVAFNAYLALLVWPTIALGWIINTLQRGLGAMERIDEVLRVASEEPPPPAAAPVDDDPPLCAEIEIRALTFSYPGSRREERRRASTPAALIDVSLTIRAGEKVALVGPIGSGKSTLVNLLPRLYPVPPGTIFLDGRDINEIPLKRLRRAIGYVPQEAFLFSRSLRENLAFARPEATEREVADAVGLASLSGDVRGFPRGLDTVVGERGVTLSGGQRQRATLARALLGRPPLLILDDSLSSVDADTERAILDALADTTGGQTMLLISHRLSTLAGMDRIVVLDAGRVVDDGTHDELVARDGLYARLFRKRQLEQRLAGE